MGGNNASLNRLLIHMHQLNQAQKFISQGTHFDSDETMELFDSLEKEIQDLKKHIEYIIHYERKDTCSIQ